MNEYKCEYVFTKNDDGRIVAQSIDRMHHFLLPLDFDDENVQNDVFENFLEQYYMNFKTFAGNRSSRDYTGNFEKIVVDQNQIETMIQSLGDNIKDQNVGKAILDYLIQKQYYM